jgi:hypothetical protein
VAKRVFGECCRCVLQPVIHEEVGGGMLNRLSLLLGGLFLQHLAVAFLEAFPLSPLLLNG